MRAFSASRWVVEIALLRTTTPSRCSASRADWRWWEVSCFVFSSVGESVMEVMAGVGELLPVAVGMVWLCEVYSTSALSARGLDEIRWVHRIISPAN